MSLNKDADSTKDYFENSNNHPVISAVNSLLSNYDKSVADKAQDFFNETDPIMEQFRAVCDKYNFPNIKEVFVFTVDNNQYRMFIDYGKLLDALK